ncbi:hypothetical protein [Pseudomonas sp. PDM13]|uniref:hypothetical protein n=1 Tax=Pseudomonas sp. PDM13 TaxID=2769255 RepID=UPI0021DFED85|nr:hypothetical protein [Pseudomonas sp. PDM13]MCU9947240.1 hypothetical protein [Pseudomonas sp. PDM13]
MINEVLRDVRFRSFFMSGNLVCEFLVLFFKLSDSGWVSLTISEGVSNFLMLGSDPELVGLCEIDDEFAYPINSLAGLDKYLGSKILTVYEYRISDADEGCVGVYLDFGDSGLSVIESDDCLSVVEDVVQFSDAKISLREMRV